MTVKSPRLSLALFKGVLREVRLSYGQKNVRDKQPYIFIVEQFKRYLVTGNKYCRGEHEVTHMANTYLCLLQSSRKQQELSRMYKGSGERSIEESAKLVGLGLPQNNTEHDPTT